jgi:hypothetical protein
MFFVTSGHGRFGFADRGQAVRFADNLVTRIPVGIAMVTTTVFGQMVLIHTASGPIAR